MFLDANRVALYSNVGSFNKHINLHFGLTQKDDIGEEFEPADETPDGYNYTTAIYTGLKGAEIGFFNNYSYTARISNSISFFCFCFQ